MYRLFSLCALFMLLLQGMARAENAPPTEVEALQPEAPIPIEEMRPETPSYEGAFLKMMIALLLLLFVIFFGIWIIKRLSQGRMGFFKEPKHIRVIDKRPLSPKTALYLVEVGDKQVLVAESQLEIKSLVTLETKDSSKET